VFLDGACNLGPLLTYSHVSVASFEEVLPLQAAHVTWVHRVLGGDSGVLVDPFMHVVTYTTRPLATLRESELLPSFSDP